jgi:hypothetical protein
MQERVKRFREAESLFYSKTDDLIGGFIPGLYDTGNDRIHEKDLYFDAVLTPEEAHQRALSHLCAVYGPMSCLFKIRVLGGAFSALSVMGSENINC